MKKTNKFTLTEFQNRIVDIRRHEGDWEAMHCSTDSLLGELIDGVALGIYTKKDLKMFASMLIELREFPKWYA